MILLQAIINAFLIASAISADALICGFAYGADGVKISCRAAALIDAVCGAVLTAGLCGGGAASGFIPPGVAASVCAAILILLGAWKIAGSFNKNDGYGGRVYGRGRAGARLGAAEAATLSLALSIDGLAAGFGAGLTRPPFTEAAFIVGFSLITDFAFLLCGARLGGKAAAKYPFNFARAGGLTLIILAAVKLMG